MRLAPCGVRIKMISVNIEVNILFFTEFRRLFRRVSQNSEYTLHQIVRALASTHYSPLTTHYSIPTPHFPTHSDFISIVMGMFIPIDGRSRVPFTDVADLRFRKYPSFTAKINSEVPVYGPLIKISIPCA